MDLPLRCPSCNALVVDRRSVVCTTCRKALPADWVMSPQQKAKMAALERQARLHHLESMRSLDPLTNPDSNASAIVRMLNASSIPGSP
jgi:hypothetical protein